MADCFTKQEQNDRKIQLKLHNDYQVCNFSNESFVKIIKVENIFLSSFADNKSALINLLVANLCCLHQTPLLCCTLVDLQCSLVSVTNYAGDPGCVSAISSAILQ